MGGVDKNERCQNCTIRAFQFLAPFCRCQPLWSSPPPQVDPSADFPLTMSPPLNASLADHQPIQFSLFPARPGDPTDGLELDQRNGQLRVHRNFLDAVRAANGSGKATKRRDATEVFVVVRATNAAQPEFFSDASVALLVHPLPVPEPKGKESRGMFAGSGYSYLIRPTGFLSITRIHPTLISIPIVDYILSGFLPPHFLRSDPSSSASSTAPPQLTFSAPIYRLIVREDDPAGTVLNSGTPIGVLNPDQHPHLRILTKSVQNAPMADHFRLAHNGSLVLAQQIDLEAMEDASKGVIELEVRRSLGSAGE